MNRIVKLVQRIAIIRNPDAAAGTCQIEYLDRDAREPLETVELPHPYPAGTTGIFAVPNDGAFCVVGIGFMQKPIILSLINSSAVTAQSAQHLGQLFGAGYMPPPLLKQGEVLIKGTGTTSTLYSDSGDIRYVFGNSNFVLDSDDQVTLKTRQSYATTAAGYRVSGEISRETPTSRQNITPVDRLSDAAFDSGKTLVGRNPSVRVSAGGSRSPRNPPLTESRTIHYEYSRDFDVYGPIQEGELANGAAPGGSPVRFSESRQTARTSAFDLGPHTYNSLAETVVGTGADIYGNLLDLNRKAVKFDPSLTLPQQLELMRRTIKLHIELNSRKANESVSGSSRGGPYGSAQPTRADHSRWFVDVDAEGQTKINLPASSPAGNIPLHLRYLPGSARQVPLSQRYSTAADNPSDIEDQQDIAHLSYGRGGIAVAPEYVPSLADSDSSVASWGMPYHDFSFSDLLTDTANRVHNGATLNSSFEVSPPEPERYADLLGGSLLSADQLLNGLGNRNAGGRSAWINMDGSLELALGADQADRKSLVLDTAGSVLARLGVDLVGNSAAIVADGKIRILSGAGGERTSGGFQLLVESGGFTAAIEIDDGHIKIRSAPGKSIVLDSGDNIVLNAASNVLISAEQIGHYGKFSADGSLIAPEMLMQRNGIK